MNRISSLVAWLLVFGPPAAAQEPAAPPPQSVRALLRDKEFIPDLQELIRMGERAFPELERILQDPAVDSMEIRRIFAVVSAVQADRRRFIEPAVARLADRDVAVRLSAVILLGRIGSRSDASPIVALLWDENVVVVNAAAKALSVIGGERELTALDIWIKSGNHRERIGFRQDVQQLRDALQRRVEDEKKKKGG